MTIQPLRDFILVEKPAEKEETIAGGLLYRPATSEQKVVSALVLAVGSGKIVADGSVVPLEVKAGDQVIFNKNFATEISSGGTTVLLLREDQLYAVVR